MDCSDAQVVRHHMNNQKLGTTKYAKIGHKLYVSRPMPSRFDTTIFTSASHVHTARVVVPLWEYSYTP